jgi:hypothetical protein
LGAFISESSQEVAVDDFGVLKMVPLDSFWDEIESFDPRNDGYAERLSSFFVRDGKRFFFLHLDDISRSSVAKLEQQLIPILGDIPFSFTVLGTGAQRRPVFRYFILLAVACTGVLLLSRSRRLFVFVLPVLLAFGWSGFSSLVLTAILIGIWEMLREPLRELFAVRYYKRGWWYPDYAGPGLSGLFERLRPFRINCLFAFIFLGFFVVFSNADSYSPIPIIAGLLCFFFLYFLSLCAEAIWVQKNRHIQFTPVLLFPLRVKTFSLFPLLFSFGIVSVLALFLPLSSPDFYPSLQRELIVDSRYFISSEEYYRHIVFQSTFSFRPLDQDWDIYAAVGDLTRGTFNQEGFLRYYLGEDGLIAGSTSYVPGEFLVENLRSKAPQADYMPFPLEKLMDFLIHYDMIGEVVNEPSNVSLFDSLKTREWFSVVFILLICMLNLLKPGMGPRIQSLVRVKAKKELPVLRDKRIAA